MTDASRKLAVIGRLGMHPLARLSLPGRRILAYLAVVGHPVARATAASGLWPDLPEDVGRANLRRAIWCVPPGWIVAVGDELMLDAECDLAEARGAVARAIAGEPLGFDEIALLSADILPGWHEEWTLPAQDAFHLLRVQALEAACRTMTASGDLALATQAGAAAVAAEPLRESAVEALIDAHLAQRNRFEAAQCFRSLERRLHEELGVAPESSLTDRLSSIGLVDRPVRRAAARR